MKMERLNFNSLMIQNILQQSSPPPPWGLGLDMKMCDYNNFRCSIIVLVVAKVSGNKLKTAEMIYLFFQVDI